MNIAEGNGKTADADRRRYFEIARGSALECAAIQDVLVVGKALEETESQNRKTELDDPDPDSDSDLEEIKPQQRGGGGGIPPPHR